MTSIARHMWRAAGGGAALTLTLALAVGSSACGSDSGPDCDAPGTACTWAGVPGVRGFGTRSGDPEGDGVFRLDTRLNFPVDLTFGPDGLAYIADWNNHSVRRVNADGTLETVIGDEVEGDGSKNETDRLPVGNPEGAPGTEVQLNHPTGITFLSDGTLVLAAWHNNKIRLWDPDTGISRVMAGDNYCYADNFDNCSGDGGPAAESQFNLVRSIVVDSDENLYVLDQANERIRRVANDNDDRFQRTITTLAGDGSRGYSGDGATVESAEFNLNNADTPQPQGALALRGTDLYMADYGNNRVRHIDLTTGAMECVAGNGKSGYAGDGGKAIDAQIEYPDDIEFGPDGRLYIAAQGNNAIRAVDLDTGTIETVAGNGQPCSGQPDTQPEEGVPADQVQLCGPSGVAFDPDGNLYIADYLNHRIVRIAR